MDLILQSLRAAMGAPSRQVAFRWIAAAHALTVGTVLALLPATAAAYTLLILGMLEGAAVIGWRLVQIPKSPALEFVLVSTVPGWLFFLAELSAGIGRLLFIQAAGLPLLIASVLFRPDLDWTDALLLVCFPTAWGMLNGLGLSAWIFLPQALRRVGEGVAMLGVLAYLLIGVLAAERLPVWLQALPPALAQAGFQAVMALHDYNPFGMMRYWFSDTRSVRVALDRLLLMYLLMAAAGVILAAVAGRRLVGHFRDRHYRTFQHSRVGSRGRMGDRPLAWWAVRRVMEYSGRVNLYLAGGFCCAYAAFILAGDAWPAWVGRGAFQLFENYGGPAMLATAMAVMASVPAAYQFGLWDANPADRSRRLELLLLTELDGGDYAHAAFRAAWRRGRGYLAAAALLVIAAAAAGRITWVDASAAGLGSAALWLFAFALGFRGFTTGHQTNGLASLLTLGAPMLLAMLWSSGWHTAAAMIPTAAVFLPLKTGATLPWAVGLFSTTALAGWMLVDAITHCDGKLRGWLDANCGRAVI